MSFVPHFQPIINIPSGQICGYEALAREQLPSGEITSYGPYFHQVLALGDITGRETVTTRSYRDRVTQELLQTIGLTMSDGRILLVDYMVN